MSKPFDSNSAQRAAAPPARGVSRAALLRRSVNVLAATAALIALSPLSLRAQNEPIVPSRANIDQKGSLLMYSLVEVKWNATGAVVQDTFIQLLNDFAGEVRVQFYFINGDAPTDAIFDRGNPPRLLERAHPGWNWVDTQFALTADQPTYWSAASGQPLGVPQFGILDAGNPTGRPDSDPENPGGRVVRGYLIGWAVDSAGHEIRWNHLSGSAVVVNYIEGAAAEYPAWVFQAHSAPHGQQLLSCLAFNLESGQCVSSQLIPGRIDLDGYEYDNPPDKLMFPFTAAGSSLVNPGSNLPPISVDTELVLFPVGADLRQDNEGPITTKAKFDIWNENEVRFSGTERCLTCWDKTALGDYTEAPIPNHFLISVIQTNSGKARVAGLGSIVCAGPDGPSVGSPLLGVAKERFNFVNGLDTTAISLIGQGDATAQIRYDIIAPPEESHE